MPIQDLPLDGQGATYEQIYRALRGAILSGRAPAGLRLPSTRALAADLTVSRNTVLAAYEALLAEGYAKGRRGSGTYVASQLPETPEASPVPAPSRSAPARLSRWGRWVDEHAPVRHQDAIRQFEPLPFDFRPCVPDLDLLPSEDWRRAVARRATHMPAAVLDYGDPAGSPALREELARYVARARGVRCSADQIVVVAGLAQALDLSARLFLERGDAVLLEEPHYWTARQVFRAVGARLVCAPVDAEGVAVPKPGARRFKLAYVTPSHQFPTGAVLSLTRRLALLDWAERTSAYILEDDYDSEFRYGGRAIEALKSLDRDGRVLYVGTVSKTLFPAVRTAYMVLPEPLVPLFRNARWLTDHGSPVVEQEALTELLRNGGFERHVRRARTLYGRRRQALIDALERHLGDRASFVDSRAGLHLLVRIEGLSARELPAVQQSASERGVRIYPGAICYAMPPKHAELLLGFTRLSESELDAGISRLAEVLAR